MLLENGTTYISDSSAKKLYMKNDTDVSKVVNGTNYIKLRDIAEKNEQSVIWTADRLIITHNFIEVFFGYPEFSEIEVALSRGGLYE